MYHGIFGRTTVYVKNNTLPSDTIIVPLVLPQYVFVRNGTPMYFIEQRGIIISVS